MIVLIILLLMLEFWIFQVACDREELYVELNLDNVGIMFAASRIRNYPLIEEVNLSDNNVRI